MTKIMIVEDEAGLVTLLKYNLEKQGYETCVAMDGKDVLALAATENPDLILLDWMLPNVSGIDLCREIRRSYELRNIPIIMLTARGDEADKIKGLSYGADDYMTKPYSIPELMARIVALLQACGAGSKNGKFNVCGYDDGFCQTAGDAQRQTHSFGADRISFVANFDAKTGAGVFARTIVKRGLGRFHSCGITYSGCAYSPVAAGAQRI